MLEGLDNFPETLDDSEEEWQEARRRFSANNSRIQALLGDLDDAKLRENVPGRDHPMKFMLHGLAQHNVYHAGQIAIGRIQLRPISHLGSHGRNAD